MVCVDCCSSRQTHMAAAPWPRLQCADIRHTCVQWVTGSICPLCASSFPAGRSLSAGARWHKHADRCPYPVHLVLLLTLDASMHCWSLHSMHVHCLTHVDSRSTDSWGNTNRQQGPACDSLFHKLVSMSWLRHAPVTCTPPPPTPSAHVSLAHNRPMPHPQATSPT
jgi:hypothetical protein